MIITNLFVFEIVEKNYIYFIKALNKIRGRKYCSNFNNILTIVTDEDLSTKVTKYIDRVYKNKSTNRVFQIVKKNDFIYDNLVHIVCLCDINFDELFILISKNKFIVSNDKFNNVCRIYPSKILSKKHMDSSYNKFLASNSYFNVAHNLLLNINSTLYSLYIDFVSKKISDKNLLRDKVLDHGIVTVIMTCFNAEKTIFYAINSILNQTYKNLEIIIIDDCSNDNTINIIKEIISSKVYNKIKFIINNQNKGCYYSKNIGLKNMNPLTEFICFQDADDVSKSTRVSKQINFMMDNNLLACSCLGYFNNITKMPMISLVFKKAVFKKLGYFNINRFGSDEEYYYRLFAYYDTKFTWNSNTKYDRNETDNIGFFADYKNFRVLKEVLYLIYQQPLSLTKIYSSDVRGKLSNQFLNKFRIISRYNEQEKVKHLFYNFVDQSSEYNLFDILDESLSAINNNINELINYSNDDNSFYNENYESKFTIDVPSYSNSSEEEVGEIYNFDCSQSNISRSLGHLKDRFLKKYNLVDYSDINSPVLFFGVYNEEDVVKIENHNNDIYIIWGGTDFDEVSEFRKNIIKRVLKVKNIKVHYAISTNLMRRLMFKNVNYKRIDINLVDFSLFKKVYSYGSCIFIYNGLKPGNEDIYGRDIYEKVVKKLQNFNFIYSNNLNAKYEEMPSIYSKCFIALRLTKNDGNANMVQELIEMNIPCIHNGDYPTINWDNENDIIENILTTYKNEKLNITDLNKKILTNNYYKKVLIIFEKDLTIIDGSYRWLINLIELFKINFNKITVICDCKNSKIAGVDLLDIYNINFNNLDLSKYDYICFRPYKIKLSLSNEDLSKIILFINSFDIENVSYYKKFRHIFAQSILVKDELEYNRIDYNKIDIFPPLIRSISNEKNKNDVISFVYSGTLKEEYFSYEFLELFNRLSEKYEFKISVFYGKIKKSNESYDLKLTNLLNKLKNNKYFYIKENESYETIMNVIKSSHYGLVLHKNIIDNKQQSTKLIEYLSLNCIPIKSLNFLNSMYYENESSLTFENIKELEDIITSILDKKYNYTDFKINHNKLKNHKYDYNLAKIYELCTIKSATKDIKITEEYLKNSVDILITNKLINRHYANVTIYLNMESEKFAIHSSVIRSFILNEKFVKKDIFNKNEKILIFNRGNFSVFDNLDIEKYYSLIYDNRVFDYKIDSSIVNLNNITKTDDDYLLLKSSSYLAFNFRLKKDKLYLFNIDIETESEGHVLVNVNTYFNGNYQDINRNLHFLNKNNKKLQFITKVVKNDSYEIKIKVSSKNKYNFEFRISQFVICELTNLNSLNDQIYIINMSKDKEKYLRLKNTFEQNHIIPVRSEGVDGNIDIIKNQYLEYLKIPYNHIEKKIGRKQLVSPGAFGYLYSMKDIFKDAILKNYEFIMINDDDIGLCKDFLLKFDTFLKSINKPKLIMLGSSQWDWEEISINNNYYIPNNSSNGSFCNIYHRTTFESIYKKILDFDSPFDSNPMKNIFNYGKCFVSYPNLAIAQLEESSIFEKKNINRSYDRFKWNVQDYNFPKNSNDSYIKLENIKKRKNKLLFILGLVTYHRTEYLSDSIKTLLLTLSDNIDYILVFADGNSNEINEDKINSFDYKDNISIVIIKNPINFIYRQSNSIFKYSLGYNFDFGFLMNDDLLFLKKGWVDLYYNCYLKNNVSHLVNFCIGSKRQNHSIIDGDLASYVSGENCQGAFFTFTKDVLDNVGFFDEESFKIRGQSHIDFTLRCCRKGFNNLNNLYDVDKSNDYLILNNNLYVSTFEKLPLLLRELYKVDIYEESKRKSILNDSNRVKINIDFELKF